MKATRLATDCDDGYRYWSDGQADGSMFPVLVVWARCPGCSLPFATVTAERSAMPKGPSGRKLPETLPLDTDAYRLLIDKTVSSGNRLEEKQLRIDWWHHLNDVIRPGHLREMPALAVRDRELSGNLARLAELLDEAEPRDRILKAELLRETGSLEGCLELLVDVPPFLRWLAGHLATHTAAGNDQLFGLLKVGDGWAPVHPLEGHSGMVGEMQP